MKEKIAIIGCGNIGEQILRYLKLEKGLKFDINISRRTKSKGCHLARKYKVNYFPNNIEAIKDAKIIWLCVGPQQFSTVLKEIRPFVRSNQVIISVAVAISQKYLKKFFPRSPVIRYMPSPLITEGKGIAILVEDKRKLPSKWKKIIAKWSSELYTVPDSKMHLYTTLASCSSAFIAALLVNLLSDLPGSGRDQLEYKRVILGASRDTLAFLEGKSISEWKKMVEFAATPEGVTVGGLKVINSKIARKIAKRIVLGAVKKSKRVQKSCEK